MSDDPLERRLRLDNDLSSVTRGRHFVRDVLVEWQLAALVEDAELATSELVANAVRHAGTDLVLSIRADTAILITIEDGRPELPRPLGVGAASLVDHGRGLHIVAAISHDWGIRPTPHGKAIWFALARPTSDGMGHDADIVVMHPELGASGPTSTGPSPSRRDPAPPDRPGERSETAS
ncbi:MAG: ATP-binding protein [Actinomycetota bacterium]|nr:ATP-binding protein [Actinomycetota bacterium]